MARSVICLTHSLLYTVQPLLVQNDLAIDRRTVCGCPLGLTYPLLTLGPNQAGSRVSGLGLPSGNCPATASEPREGRDSL